MDAFSGPNDTPVYDFQQEVPLRDVDAPDWYIWHFTHTHGADEGTGLINLGLTPHGRIQIDFSKSRVWSSQMGTSASLSLGYGAHTSSDGQARLRS